jgi:UDP-N-acetyl-alpha-D-muramoyl-L-alanyl-L-glutamate epimerase
MKYRKFIFDHYSFDPKTRLIQLHYSFDDEIKFVETFKLDFEFSSDYNRGVLDRALFGLFMMAGVSYYKAGLPESIEIRHGKLAKNQADFFTKTYRLGLGEFAYINQLPLVAPVFPVTASTESDSREIQGLEGSLVAIGGGKDSLVTIELLRSASKEVSTWMVNHSDQLEPLLDKVSVPHLAITRQLSPELLKLNQEGAYNGHIPVSAILNFVGVICSILTGRANVVLSNEWSAGEGNAEHQGVVVNHQYSKGFEYERDFADYVKNWVTPSVQVFSLLRPLSELKIAEIFCKRYLDKYEGLFSSCNRNFHLFDHASLFWCGECPKCAFVYLIFAPFVPKQRLVQLFGGKSLFESEKLVPTYEELLGLVGHKPFECVGEIMECRQAVVMARATGQYSELDRYKFDDPKFDYKQMHEDNIPLEFKGVLDLLTIND